MAPRFQVKVRALPNTARANRTYTITDISSGQTSVAFVLYCGKITLNLSYAGWSDVYGLLTLPNDRVMIKNSVFKLL